MWAMLVVSLMAALVPGVVAIPAAHADSRPALDKCLAGATPDHSETVTQAGSQLTTSYPNRDVPDNAILPGDVVRVTITGTITYDLWGTQVGPDGTSAPTPSDFPFPLMRRFSSVANWNTNPGGWVGSPMQTTSLARCTPAPATYPVRLLYFINDNPTWDNGGAWTIRTDVFRAPGRVAVEDLEITQSIQTPDAQVPLLAGKPTFVRVFVKATDDGLGPMSGVLANMTVEGSSRIHAPLGSSTITASLSGSDRRSLTDSFVFQVDPAVLSVGSRRLTVTVYPPPGRGDGRPFVRTAPLVFQQATSVNIVGARYSYYNVPPAMQAQLGLSSSWWQARPASAWEPQRVTAENALPLSRLTITDMAPSNSWGSVYIDCRAVQDAGGRWGCAGYEDARTWANRTIDQRCPSGGCWIAVLQPESVEGHFGADWTTPAGNQAINLQGEPRAVEQGLTLAHEIGHGLGLGHTFSDPNYPRSDGGLGPFVGFRYSPTLALVPGTDSWGRTTAYDLSSYSSPAWFSPYSYCKALQRASAGRTTCPPTLRG